MAVSVYKVKKWYRMLTGKSIMHVNQNMGKSFVPGELRGYFNNLTEKVLKDSVSLEKQQLPMTTDESGKPVVFPVTIFQYGLGAWDLFLQTGETKYADQFMRSAQWALDNQLESGAWSNFYFVYPDNPYGAMCQGEGASVLLRAYSRTKEEKYLLAAKKAVDFMLSPLADGGTTCYDHDRLVLMEYTHLPAVLNGWVFALFGLYDMTVVSPEERYQQALKKTVDSLMEMMPCFDNGYWSMYDERKIISSPFYHDLHIAQMEALYLATQEEIFRSYQKKFERYRDKKWNSIRAFIKKVWQKVVE